MGFWARIRKNYLDKEMAAYVGFGTLTTLVDFGSFNLFFRLLDGQMGEDAANLAANAISWVFAVVFSYAVNKWFVFHRHAPTRRLLIKEMWQFLAARLFSLGISEVGVYLLFTVAGLDENVSKMISAVFVMISNYFFMKWLVFKPREEDTDG